MSDIPTPQEVREEKEYTRAIKEFMKGMGDRAGKPPEIPDPEPGVYYRWAKDDRLEATGMPGSGGYVRDGFFHPYNNPTYGDHTVYTADSRNGSRGFIQEEMLRNYVNQPYRPLNNETWHLYTMRIPPEEVAAEHFPIKLYKFSPMERIQTPEEWQALTPEDDPRYKPNRDPKNLSELIKQIPRLTLEDARAFKRYMVTGEGRRQPLSGRDKVRGVPLASPVRSLTHAEMTQDPEEMTPAQRLRVRDILFFETANLEAAMKVAQYNAPLTHEVQLLGPIKPEYITNHGSVTFDPELWDDHGAERNNPRKFVNQHILPQRARDQIKDLLDRAELHEADV